MSLLEQERVDANATFDERSGYRFAATCTCGADLKHLASGRPMATEAQAIAECGECKTQWQVIVHLRPVRERGPGGWKH